MSVIASLILTLALAAPAPKDGAKAATPTDHPLVGEWVIESHVASGKPLPQFGRPERITITRDRWKIFKEIGAESCVSVDATKDPPHVDVWVPSQEEDQTCRGIYKIEGDTLTVCYRPGKERPTRFESTPKSGIWLMTLKRVRAKD